MTYSDEERLKKKMHTDFYTKLMRYVVFLLVFYGMRHNYLAIAADEKTL